MTYVSLERENFPPAIYEILYIIINSFLSAKFNFVLNLLRMMRMRM